MQHVRYCSPFVDETLQRHTAWADDLDQHQPPTGEQLQRHIDQHGLDAGLRRFRACHMVRIIWRDLCGLASLDETFADLTALAECCLQAALDAHYQRLVEKHGVPRDADGAAQALTVIGLGKFGGGELNLSSDIDIIFCYGHNGECDGGGNRPLSNEQFFIRQARAVIASLSDITEHGFCFRVDTRLRPFGDSGPLCTSLAALEQYYQREGRDWERYALIKARPVAGDLDMGRLLMQQVRPFVYRRYIDFSAVEALQDMHANVRDDARRTDRLDDIKRGPGGIREIEFLAQCFQLLRGGRETSLQTPSLQQALASITELGLLDAAAVSEIRQDYVYLRQLENRIQALRDQQTHSMPAGEDLLRLARAMGHGADKAGAEELHGELARVRQRVEQRFRDIFPEREQSTSDPKWVEAWRHMQSGRQDIEPAEALPAEQPMSLFLRSLQRLPLSQRAHRRLDQFMPVLLQRLDRQALDDDSLNRIFDLVLAICQRSAYLLLLVQNASALDRLIDLFQRSTWIAAQVIRFPALLDELIDPSLGQQIPSRSELQQSINRLGTAAPGTEMALEGLNYLKLATTLRIAVAQLEGSLTGEDAQHALARLADGVLQGVLDLARGEIEARHGRFPPLENADSEETAADEAVRDGNTLAIIAYGSLGANETGYESDLDIIFLFNDASHTSDGQRSLTPERYYARLAQRLLSFLTAMTPAGRLYEVDTRLRPNGRAGSLVSSLAAFSEYQLKQAWTWELQALTRSRFVAGNPRTGEKFREIRQQALARPRDRQELQRELADMRARMAQEHGAADAGPKHQPGGLVDIEFLIQLGVLSLAHSQPDVLRHTASLQQLKALVKQGFFTAAEGEALRITSLALRQQRMLASLVSERPVSLPPQASQVADLYARLLGEPDQPPAPSA